MAGLALGLILSLVSFPSPAAAKTAADYYVHSLPGQPDGPLLKMHAGYTPHELEECKMQLLTVR